jgi:hypothetical protein
VLRGALTHRLRPSGLPGATLGFPLGEQGKVSQHKLTKPQIMLEPFFKRNCRNFLRTILASSAERQAEIISIGRRSSGQFSYCLSVEQDLLIAWSAK